MSLPAKKEKRRIVPVQVFDDGERKEDDKPVKAALKTAFSETTQKHFKTLYDKDVESKLRERAIKLGYEKERKVRPSRPGSSHKKKSHANHGSHHEHMDSLSSYIKHFTTMKTHSKGVSLYDYLKKNYDKHLYFSSATKRFRKI